MLPKVTTTRVPAPAKPPFFDHSLEVMCGKNPYGDPMVRVKWGWDCTTFRNGDPNALAYPGPFLSRWIIEKWQPAKFFGKWSEWEESRYFVTDDGKRIDALGPFPSKGMYVMVMPLIAAGLHGTKPGDYIPCSNDVLIMIDAMRQEFEQRTWNCYSSPQLLAKLQQQMAEEEAKLNEDVDNEVAEWDDYILTHQDDINKDRVQFYRPGRSLWTPNGEHQI